MWLLEEKAFPKEREKRNLWWKFVPVLCELESLKSYEWSNDTIIPTSYHIFLHIYLGYCGRIPPSLFAHLFDTSCPYKTFHHSPNLQRFPIHNECIKPFPNKLYHFIWTFSFWMKGEFLWNLLKHILSNFWQFCWINTRV